MKKNLNTIVDILRSQTEDSIGAIWSKGELDGWWVSDNLSYTYNLSTSIKLDDMWFDLGLAGQKIAG